MTEAPDRIWLEDLCRAVVYPYFSIMHRLRWFGRENIPDGPALLAANHQSFYDPVALGVAVDRILIYMATTIYYRMPVVGWLMGLFGAVPVKEGWADPGSLSAMLAALEKGYLCGIFPEGRRSPDGALTRPHEGAATLALRAGVPLVPVTIAGAHEAWPIGQTLPRPARICVYIGRPLRVEGESTRSRRREITRRLMLRIADGFERLARPDLAERSRERLAREYGPV